MVLLVDHQLSSSSAKGNARPKILVSFVALIYLSSMWMNMGG